LFALDSGPAVGLFDTNYSLPNILNDVFLNNSDIPLSDADTYEMAVSDTEYIYIYIHILEFGYVDSISEALVEFDDDHLKDFDPTWCL